MKKIFVVLSVITAVLLMSSSCISKKTSNEIKAEKVRVWLKDSHISGMMDKIVKQYNENEGSDIGVEVEYKGIDEDEFEKLYSIVYATNSEPEIMSFPYSYSMRELLKNDWVKPIEVVEGGLQMLRKQDTDCYTFEGKKIAAKLTLSAYRVVYNKDIFKKCGIVDEYGNAKEPKTWEDVAKFAEIVRNTSDKYGIVLPMKNEVVFWYNNLIYPFIPAVEEKIENAGESDLSIFKDAFTKFYFKIKNDKSYYPNPEWIDNNNAQKLFADGEAAMKISSSSDVSFFIGKNIGFDWGAVYISGFSSVSDSKYVFDNTGYAYFTGAVMKMKNAQKAVNVYAWLTGTEMKNALYKNNKYIIAEPPNIEKKENNIWESMEMYDKKFSAENLDRVITDKQKMTRIFSKMWETGELILPE